MPTPSPKDRHSANQATDQASNQPAIVDPTNQPIGGSGGGIGEGGRGGKQKGVEGVEVGRGGGSWGSDGVCVGGCVSGHYAYVCVSVRV